MSGTGSNPPRPELTTTKVSGGGSAKLVALAAVLLLGGVVYVGVSGRTPAPPPAASNPRASSAIAEMPSAQPSASPLDPQTISEIKPEGAPPVYDGYGVELVVQGRRYPASLYGLSPGVLSARYHVPTELAHGVATLGLAQVISSVSHDIVTPIESWQVSLERPESTDLLLGEIVEGKPLDSSLPALAQQGFRITFGYADAPDGLELWVEVDTQPVQPRTPEYHYAVSTLISGGLLRAALNAAAAGDFTGTLVIDAADVGGAVQIDLGRQWREQGLDIFESFASWSVSLRPLHKGSAGPVNLLIDHVPPGLTRLNGPLPVIDGYTMTIRGRQEGPSITLYFELVLASPAQGDGVDPSTTPARP